MRKALVSQLYFVLDQATDQSGASKLTPGNTMLINCAVSSNLSLLSCRIENRTSHTVVSVCQFGLDEDASIHLQPCSTTKFSWDNPYGTRLLDVSIEGGNEIFKLCINLEKPIESSTQLEAHGLQLHVADIGDTKVVKFMDDERTSQMGPIDNHVAVSMQNEMQQTNSAPLELILELGVVGVCLIDHRPRELLYLYLQKVFISYSTGYDAGTTSR